MHSSLKRMALEAAKKYRTEREQLERAARALVLCPPDCEARHPRWPKEHAHTYWDMLQAAGGLDYAWQCRKRREEQEDMARMDVGPYLRRAGAGDVHIRALEKLEGARPATQAASRWLKQARPMPLPWLALLGATDAGKTQAAVLALAHFVRRHPWGQQAGGPGAQLQPFVLVHGSELASMARTLRDFGAAASAREREEDLRRAKVLVLDDIGAERMDPDTLGLLHSLADLRYRERRLTVWTANLSAEDFEKRVDFGGQDGNGEQRGRLWRRIRELGHVVQLGRKVRTWEGGRETTVSAPARDGRAA